MNASTRNAAREGGQVLAVTLRVLLLVCVFAQLVYLASRQRVRLDMTSDRLWTSTESTRRLLDKLDKRLLIEAYFSPIETLPAAHRESRVWAENFLDEVVQLGKGKVALQRFDPNSDKAISDKAMRVGIQPQNLRSQSSTSLSLDQHWQGLRLVYGGERQAVIPQFLPPTSFAAEALVVPKIKEVITTRARRFGYMEWPATAIGGSKPGGIGWNAVRTVEDLVKRYEFQNYKDEDGALLPDDVDTLFLFRPKELSDRQKYVLDQFLMGGGTLVVFADAAEYAIGPQRLMRRLPFQLDAAGSESRFVEQLRHYGLDWRLKVVADLQRDANRPLQKANEYFAVAVQNTIGRSQLVPIQYPYFFHALNADWARFAEQLAKGADGRVDGQLAKGYRESLQPGIPAGDFLFDVSHKLNRSPGFYWPTWVGLRTLPAGEVDLPSGVEGRVLLWSSPNTLVEDPPQVLDPIGRDPRQMATERDKFLAGLNERLAAEPRLQAPLMAEVKGRFASWFAGRARPKRPSELKEEAAREQAAKERGEAGGSSAETGDEKVEPAGAPAERAMRTAAERPGRIVMVGDATFLRDDVIRGDYAQAGGPVSGTLAMPFFASMLDWLADDQDLVALQSRAPTDRTVKLVDDGDGSPKDPRSAEQELRRRTRLLVIGNVVAPCALLLAFGLVVGMVRRAQKRAFLAGLR